MFLGAFIYNTLDAYLIKITLFNDSNNNEKNRIIGFVLSDKQFFIIPFWVKEALNGEKIKIKPSYKYVDKHVGSTLLPTTAAALPTVS